MTHDQAAPEPLYDAALPGFSYTLLRQHGALADFRGHRLQDGKTILMRQAACATVEAQAALQLNHELALRDLLDPAWAVKPLASTWRHGALALFYDDDGAEPLDRHTLNERDVDTFLALALGSAGALRRMHGAGLLHRDIKPSHILVDAHGVCRLSGFGAAVRLAGIPDALANAESHPAAPLIGTLAYMSPEHTGRTGRAPDARSDLYSLGVTLYELLTGRLPFQPAHGGGAGEWVHCHLAYEALAPHALFDSIPKTLSLLLLKLLAKNPDQRYQSAAGLAADLQRCRLAWRAAGRIEAFRLGRRDHAAQLVFPARLYARAAPLRTLLGAFDGVCASGGHALAVLGGPSGIGKSALLAQLFERLRLRRACVALARADRARRDQPYGALIDALRQLVLQILGQDDAEVAYWQQRLGHALGPHARLAVHLLPELAMLAGRMPLPLPPTEHLPPGDAQRHTDSAMHGLVSAFASAQRPLVLLIDDMQWLDDASMALLENLTGGAATPPLLLVLACDDGDARAGGQRWSARTLPLLRAQAGVCHDLPLAPLALRDTERLVAATLHGGRRHSTALAELVQQQSAGHPLRARQLLRAVFDQGLIARNANDDNWQYDLDAIRARDARPGLRTGSLAMAVDCNGLGFSAALARGNMTLACFACKDQVCDLLARGDRLDAVSAEIARGLDFARQQQVGEVEAILRSQQQYVDQLRGTDQPAGPVDGAGAQGDPEPAPASTPAPLFWSCLYQAVGHYLAIRYRDAAAAIEQAGTLAWSVADPAHLFDYHFFSGLILAAPEPDPQRQAGRRERIGAHHAEIDLWAQRNRAPYAGKAALLRAEMHRLDGDGFAALGCYEAALAHAQQHGFDHCAAMAHELAARACHDWGHVTAAQVHARGARDAYLRWGALAKAAQIERLYPQWTLRRAVGESRAPVPADTAAIRDIDSVIRSARALSEEIRVDELVRTLMRIALEYAGAQRGLLLHMHGSVPFIEACARTAATGIAVELLHAAPGADDLPVAMLNTAIRTRQRVSADGQAGPFDAEPYLLAHPGCACLCIPMLRQSELVGVLYLENRLAPQSQVFTGEQTRVLELLAAQAAVSLQTARLYAELLEENVERRRIEKALRASETSLALGEQISHTGSWNWDIGRDLLLCSAEFCRLFGFDPAQPLIPFDRFLDRLHRDDRDRVSEQVLVCVGQCLPINIEYRIVDADGTLRHLSGVGKPVLDSRDYYVGTVADITARRAAEDTLRAAQSDLARVARATTVGQLTASIAHEINQPLMSIAANAGASLRWLARNPPQITEARAGLLDIASESRRAGDMIQSLQALTRNAPPVFDTLDLHQTIRDILFISRNELERRHVTLALSLQAERSDVVGDCVQLQQVLLNLVINGVEAIGEADPASRILSIGSALTGDDGGRRIRIVIDDTGVGLGQAGAQGAEGEGEGAIARLFDAFYTTKKNGMGMGLAICRAIVDNHHGRIGAAPRQPHGSRFWFELPLAEPGAPC